MKTEIAKIYNVLEGDFGMLQVTNHGASRAVTVLHLGLGKLISIKENAIGMNRMNENLDALLN